MTALLVQFRGQRDVIIAHAQRHISCLHYMYVSERRSNFSLNVSRDGEDAHRLEAIII